MRSKAIICCVALLAATLAVPAVDAQKTMQAEAVNPQDLEGFEVISVEGARIRNEDLPVGHRMFILTSFLVTMIQNSPDAAERYSRDKGLGLDRASLFALAELYGDFNERLGERQEAEMRGLEDQPEVRAVIGRQLTLDLFTHGGVTLGRWMAQLRDQGKDVGHLLGRLLDGTSRGSLGGTSITLEDLETDAAAFATGFEREYGSAPEALLLAE